MPGGRAARVRIPGPRIDRDQRQAVRLPRGDVTVP